MKRIAVDGYEANVPQRLGSSQVAFELLRSLEKIDKKNSYTIFLPSKPLNDLPKERKNWNYKILKPKRLWTRIALPLALYKGNFDLVFSPTHYIPRFSPAKRIVTIFDLSFLHFPESFLKKDLWKLNNWTEFSIKNADHIITISNFSKKDITEKYGVDPGKITVAYPGHNSQLFKPIKDKKALRQVLNKFGIEDSYIIYIGTLQPRKNLLRLIDVFKEISGIKLVIAGKTKGLGREGWMFKEILERPEQLGIKEKVIFTGFIPTEDLAFLLGGAIGLIQPSLWEGFGIPVVDAMAMGIPVLISDNSSLPEIVDGAGLNFNPYSSDMIKDSILEISENPALWKKLSRRGIIRAKKFSWDKMASEVLRVFEGVI